MRTESKTFLPDRSKKLLSITAFFAAFVFSAAFAGFFTDNSANSTAYYHDHTNCFRFQYDAVTADAIDDFLSQDIQNGEHRFDQLYLIDETFTPPFGTSSMDEYAATVGKYVDDSSSMDDGNLPRDVRQAWHKHMRAWQNYAGFLKDANDLNYSKQQLRIKNVHYGNEIDRTWLNLLSISRTYGSYVSD